MSRDKDLLHKRNKSIKKSYAKMRDAHPQWRHDAILKELSEKVYFLSPKTLSSIINS